MVSKKKNPLLVLGWDRKIEIGKSRDANIGDHQYKCVYPTLTIMMDSYYLNLWSQYLHLQM